ncbi:MAG: metal-dependent transcriptional regulator [Bacteroidetes bacterium]|nr:MAG: metal-dependent transcriptional regulator [Bacteroidota bacterium]
MNSFTEENYLKAIYKIAEMGDGAITTNDIARKLSTTAASVTDMLKKLSKKKFIKYKRYNGLSMTESGKRIALAVIRKHRLWEMFLVKALKFKWDEVHDIAEQMEHVQSEKLVQHIDKALNYPKFDPHGDPIPDTNGKMVLSKERSVLLADVKEGRQYMVTGVVDHSRSFLQLLDKSGIILGSKVRVKAVQPYDRSLSLLLNGKKNLFISNQIAKNILVSNNPKT